MFLSRITSQIKFRSLKRGIQIDPATKEDSDLFGLVIFVVIPYILLFPLAIYSLNFSSGFFFDYMVSIFIPGFYGNRMLVIIIFLTTISLTLHSKKLQKLERCSKFLSPPFF